MSLASSLLAFVHSELASGSASALLALSRRQTLAQGSAGGRRRPPAARRGRHRRDVPASAPCRPGAIAPRTRYSGGSARLARASRMACKNEIAEAKLRTARKGGELLLEQPGLGSIGGDRKAPAAPVVDRGGLTPTQAKRWQALARLADEDFEQFPARVRRARRLHWSCRVTAGRESLSGGALPPCSGGARSCCGPVSPSHQRSLSARDSNAPRSAVTARLASPPFGTGRVSLGLGRGRSPLLTALRPVSRRPGSMTRGYLASAALWPPRQGWRELSAGSIPARRIHARRPR